MGTQRGPLNLHGRIGNLVFYKLNGKMVVRLKSGPSKSQVKKNRNYARTRENNAEFGGASTMAKNFRLAFAANLLRFTADPGLNGRLVSIFKKINNASNEGIRGQRPFLLSQFKDSLQHFEFSTKMPVAQILKVKPVVQFSMDRISGSIYFESFKPSLHLALPPGATHFEIVSLLGVVSNMIFVPGARTYLEESPVAYTWRARSSSGLLPVKMASVNILLDPILPAPPPIHSSQTVLQTMGIFFYQEINGAHYLMKGNSAMRIEQAG